MGKAIRLGFSGLLFMIFHSVEAQLPVYQIGTSTLTFREMEEARSDGFHPYWAIPILSTFIGFDKNEVNRKMSFSFPLSLTLGGNKVAWENRQFGFRETRSSLNMGLNFGVIIPTGEELFDQWTFCLNFRFNFPLIQKGEVFTDNNTLLVPEGHSNTTRTELMEAILFVSYRYVGLFGSYRSYRLWSTFVDGNNNTTQYGLFPREVAFGVTVSPSLFLKKTGREKR